MLKTHVLVLSLHGVYHDGLLDVLGLGLSLGDVYIVQQSFYFAVETDVFVEDFVHLEEELFELLVAEGGLNVFYALDVVFKVVAKALVLSLQLCLQALLRTLALLLYLLQLLQLDFHLPDLMKQVFAVRALLVDLFSQLRYVCII